MAEPHRVTLCASSRRTCVVGLRRVGLSLPILICPILILIMGGLLPHPGHRWLIYGMAFVLALPALPVAAALLHALWTRREVVLDLRERTVTEIIRTPWRTVTRWCPFGQVLRVRVAVHPSRRDLLPWSLALELVGGTEVPLGIACGTDDALTQAVRTAQLLGVRVQGRIG